LAVADLLEIAAMKGVQSSDGSLGHLPAQEASPHVHVGDEASPNHSEPRPAASGLSESTLPPPGTAT